MSRVKRPKPSVLFDVVVDVVTETNNSFESSMLTADVYVDGVLQPSIAAIPESAAMIRSLAAIGFIALATVQKKCLRRA